MWRIKNATELFREWLAWKIFPEFGIYIEVARRMGSLEEADRIEKIFDEANSACSDWAVALFKRKYTVITKEMLDENLTDLPF